MNQKSEQRAQNCNKGGRIEFRRFRPVSEVKSEQMLNNKWAETAVGIPPTLQQQSASSFDTSPRGHKIAAKRDRRKGEREFYTPAGPCPRDEQSLLFLKSRMQCGHCPAGNDESSSFTLSPTPLGNELSSTRPEAVFRIDLDDKRRTPHVSRQPRFPFCPPTPRRRPAPRPAAPRPHTRPTAPRTSTPKPTEG
jgi:hypothetical protein